MPVFTYSCPANGAGVHLFAFVTGNAAVFQPGPAISLGRQQPWMDGKAYAQETSTARTGRAVSCHIAGQWSSGHFFRCRRPEALGIIYRRRREPVCTSNSRLLLDDKPHPPGDSMPRYSACEVNGIRRKSVRTPNDVVLFVNNAGELDRGYIATMI